MSKKSPPTRGMSLSDAKRYCRDRGGSVENIDMSGEVKFSHPSRPKALRVSNRRKDIGRVLMKWLQELPDGAK